METHRTLQSLGWLVDEVETSLAQAFEALDCYLDDRDDEPQLRFCLGYIHQVYGSLKIAQCAGGMMLVEEMEALVRALMANSVANVTEACEVLIQAIHKVPGYLKDITASGSDQPQTLLTMLNDLRAVRGEQLVSHSLLFSPDMSAVQQPAGAAPPVDDDKLKALVKKLRQMYQFALLGLIKNQDWDRNAGHLDKVFARLRELSRGTPREQLWRVAGALMEGVLLRTIPLSIAVRMLLRDLDREIRQLIEQGQQALSAPFPDTLFKSLLYYVAQCDSGSPRIQSVRTTFGLDTALPAGQINDESGMVPSYGREVVATVSEGIKEELETLKDMIDAIAAERDGGYVGLRQTLPIFKRIADTFAMTGQDRLRGMVMEVMACAEQEVTLDGKADRATMEDIASRIVDVETALIAWSADYQESAGDSDLPAELRLEVSRARTSLFRETSNAIEQLKESIVEYIAAQKDPGWLEQAPAAAAQLAGALRMADLPKPAAIIAHCGAFVDRQLLRAGVVPGWDELDALADAITSVEYYLEGLASGATEEDESILDIAHASVEKLRLDTPAEVTSLRQPAVVEPPGEAAAEAELPPVSEPEPAPELPLATIESPGGDDEVDPEIREIFIEEAQEVLAGLDEHYPRWAANPGDDHSLGETRRAFHTLKGSGRMVGAGVIAELAWAVENMLNRLLENKAEVSPVVYQCLDQVMALLPAMVNAFARSEEVDDNRVTQLRDWAHAIADGKPAMTGAVAVGDGAEGKAAGDADGEVAAETVEDTSTETRWQDEDLTESEEYEPVAGETEGMAEVADGTDTTIMGDDDNDSYQRALVDIFVGEAVGHLRELEGFIKDQRRRAPFYDHPTSAVQSALHTLKGSAQMADMRAVAEVITPLERFVREMLNFQIPVDDEVVSLFDDVVALCHDESRQPGAVGPDGRQQVDRLLARLAGLRERILGPLLGQETREVPAADPSRLHRLMTEGLEQLVAADMAMAHRQQQPLPLAAMGAELRELEQAADLAGIAPLARLSHKLADACGNLVERDIELDHAMMQQLAQAHETLLDMIDAVAAHQEVAPADNALLTNLTALADMRPVRSQEITLSPPPEPGPLWEPEQAPELLSESSEAPEPEVELEPAPEYEPEPESRPEPEFKIESGLEPEPESWPETETAPDPEAADQVQEDRGTTLAQWDLAPESDPPVATEQESAEPIASEREPVPATDERSGMETPPATALPEEVDPDVLEIFLPEADELLEEIDRHIHAWQAAPADASAPDSIKRALHTFKGGARVAGLNSLGDVSHDFETLVVSSEAAGKEPPIADMLVRHDQLLAETDKVRGLLHGTPASTPEPEPEPAPEPEPEPLPSSPEASVPKALAPEPEADTDDVTPAPAPEIPAAREEQKLPQELVKVPAMMLENLVNLAGETSISRSQVEQQVNEFIFSLDEMASTIRRMQDQVRRLGVETDAQVSFRREQIESQGNEEDFDPLEMDRYSQLQQLSRSLLESSSDLQDLRETLLDKSRDAESLLLHQSRINTDLQEGLMRTRMVPFSRLVPRLRRIVRQVASELNKEVGLGLGNVEGEIDRTVMERILPSLEHMIRNAIDHGFESADERLAAGKAAQGELFLSFAREGGDVLISLADDGRGLNVEAIRRQAIDRGLMRDDVQLSEQEIIQFIFQPGFSTSARVTHISGRGVGMDVVNSEVRQLGGDISIATRQGQGTTFHVRLPFTVSVNRALMIEAGEDSYALALNSINGVTRAEVDELLSCYENPERRLHYAGEDYEVRYLGTLLDENIRPRMDTQRGQVPLVLIHSDNRRYAVQVDALLGSREVVVKTLGPQFSRVPGLSGATILGDGRVVVILELQGLLRAQKAVPVIAPVSPEVQELEAQSAAPVIMVVDDSVTVRKVTGRFLGRQGFEVITAKDGLDAMRVLQDHTPDLMLLDIEMPGMDGFEVVRLVRTTQRLKAVPIIMITSRTGEKHRERALAMGANRYLGKPYREDVLLESVHELLGEAVAG